MRNDPRSSSSRKAALLVMTSVLGMSGCSTGTNFLSGHLDSPLFHTAVNETSPNADIVVIKTDPVAVASTSKPKAIVQPANSPARLSPGNSDWCEYLYEDAATEATIMRSPTLTGSVDDNSKANLNLGLSLSSFTKAGIVERSAEAKCRRYIAEIGLQKIAFVSPQGLTAAGYRAKAKNITGRKTEMNDLRKLITRQLQAGVITAEKATALRVAIDELSAEADAAKSQADRRLTDLVKPGQSAKNLSRDLLIADADLQDLNSELRSADVMDLSVQAGWNDDDLGDGFDVADDSFSGKVSFSVKLGALNPKRFEHEERAKQARARSITTEEGGTLWQLGILRKAHERAMQGLEDSRGKLVSAIDEANRLIAALRSVDNPEFVGPLIAARVQVMKLKAEQAAIDGSLAEIRSNMKALSTG
jgi:hypothetical protein